MTFGQSAGPSATARQVQELLDLLRDAGHGDFRDARGPMGFTQRQAGGKFTADEAAELIDQLQTAQYEADQATAGKPRGEPVTQKPPAKEPPDEKPADGADSPATPMTESERALRTASTKSLVLEVRRRGWTVTRPK
jgi:hypothetical protein